MNNGPQGGWGEEKWDLVSTHGDVFVVRVKARTPRP